MDGLRGMGNTQETRLANRQIEGRAAVLNLEDMAAQYKAQAERVLEGKDADSTTIDYEVARSAEKVHSTKGLERNAALEKLVRALNFPKHNILDTVPEEERIAFAFALVQAYQRRQLH